MIIDNEAFAVALNNQLNHFKYQAFHPSGTQHELGSSNHTKLRILSQNFATILGSSFPLTPQH
jgi:hypothetical protein